MTTNDMRRIGQQSVWTATFRDDAKVLCDPNSVTFKWQKVGSGDAPAVFVYGTNSEVERVSVGVYRFTSPYYEASGRYVCWCESTGPRTSNEQVTEVSSRTLVEGP